MHDLVGDLFLFRTADPLFDRIYAECAGRYLVRSDAADVRQRFHDTVRQAVVFRLGIGRSISARPHAKLNDCMIRRRMNGCGPGHSHCGLLRKRGCTYTQHQNNCKSQG